MLQLPELKGKRQPRPQARKAEKVTNLKIMKTRKLAIGKLRTTKPRLNVETDLGKNDSNLAKHNNDSLSSSLLSPNSHKYIAKH